LFVVFAGYRKKKAMEKAQEETSATKPAAKTGKKDKK